MKYKMIERANPQDRTKVKWYAAPVNEGKITQRDLAQDIVGLSSLSRGDILSVIENVIDTMPKYLMMGKSVNLGELGTLHISFSSDGVDKVEDFNTDMINGVRILFTPGVLLKNSIEHLSFEVAE
jgi:predicted histone-like DNA-binding protein